MAPLLFPQPERGLLGSQVSADAVLFRFYLERSPFFEGRTQVPHTAQEAVPFCRAKVRDARREKVPGLFHDSPIFRDAGRAQSERDSPTIGEGNFAHNKTLAYESIDQF
jgi:hypothetical protein